MDGEKTNELIDELLKIVGADNILELSEKLNIDNTIFSRWRKRGFPKSTGTIIQYLIEEIRLLKQKTSQCNPQELLGLVSTRVKKAISESEK